MLPLPLLKGSHCQGMLTNMPEHDQAAQLQCIWRASVGQMRELVHQLTIAICPTEHVPHHLQDMQGIVPDASSAPACLEVGHPLSPLLCCKRAVHLPESCRALRPLSAAVKANLERGPWGRKDCSVPPKRSPHLIAALRLLLPLVHEVLSCCRRPRLVYLQQNPEADIGLCHKAAEQLFQLVGVCSMAWYSYIHCKVQHPVGETFTSNHYQQALGHP
ncbi:hypothetical protein ABBQ38_005807 [Trebouxia sp. C0009 RCD-2024]